MLVAPCLDTMANRMDGAHCFGETTVEKKRCTKCGEEYPATTEYFHRDAGRKDGLHAYCKACSCEQARRWHANHREEHRERSRRYYEVNKESMKERARRWREANSERVRENNRRWREANPELEMGNHRRWYEANAGRHKENARRWREANPERAREQARRWREANPERGKENARRWHKANPERAAENDRRRRARKAGADGNHTAEDIRVQHDAQRGRCWWCGCKLNGTYHVDHRIPLSRGGSNAPENLVISCPACNCSKGTKLPHEWNGRLL